MTMRFSEAMSLGAMLHPQSFHALLVTGYSHSGTVVARTCALGAASVAILGERRAMKARTLREAVPGFGVLLDRPVPCPSCGQQTVMCAVIEHLNDDHRWTREAIAAWVETIERQQGDPATPIEEPCLTS